MSQLLIYLQNDKTHINYRLDINGQIHSEENTTLAALPEEAKDVLCIVLVPGEHVTVSQLLLPDTSQSRLVQIVPYAMEDQLIDPPEDLHFAFDKQNEQGSLQVAVVKKTTIEQWLSDFKDTRLDLRIMLPDYLAIPYEDDTWHVYLSHDKALIRIRANYGMTVDISQVIQILQLKLNEEILKPHYIKIDYCAEQANFDQKLFRDINISCEFSEKSMPIMEIFNRGLKKPTAIDLLEGAPLVHNPSNQSNSLWRIARWLALACCVIWVGMSITEYIIFKQRLNAIQTQIDTLYMQAFPQSSTVIEPLARIQQLSATLKNSASGGNFLSLIATVGQAINSQNKDVTIIEMNFSGNSLLLDLESNDFKNFEFLSQQLRRQNITVTQTNAHTTDNGVTTRFALSRGRT